MKNNWQQFLFCIIVQLLLPLLPLLIEKSLTQVISSETWTLIAGMYIIAIGVSSNNLPMLGASIVVSMFFMAVFGFIKAGNTITFDINIWALISVVSFMIIHIIERYKRHIIGDEFFVKINNMHDV
ncbi:MAG: hypothetical protein U5R06_23550 [candidate division KSB1 bacterium]|nr:hypothetical protein [candidate division KSB1 bacterium]